MSDFTTADYHWMHHALNLAAQGAMTVHPNPAVACVFVKDEKNLAEGWHQRAGQAHAEINAIKQAKESNIDLKGSTAYVTLEPCSHHGRTGPCCVALAETDVSRVVVAMQDPNPQVAGRGIEYLRAQGITVDVGILESDAKQLNHDFIFKMTHGRPFVRLKVAASLDGRTAMANGESQWITGAAEREDVQRYRAMSGAIVTGSGTWLVDNPRLNIRPGQWKWHEYQGDMQHLRQPLRVVLTRQSPKSQAWQSHLFSDGAQSLVVSHHEQPQALPGSVAWLQMSHSQNASDFLQSAFAELAKMPLNSLWVEAGAILSGAIINAGLVDELISYHAPCLMGSDARGMFELPFEHMSQRLHLSIKSVRQVGESVRIASQIREADCLD